MNAEFVEMPAVCHALKFKLIHNDGMMFNRIILLALFSNLILFIYYFIMFALVTRVGMSVIYCIYQHSFLVNFF